MVLQKVIAQNLSKGESVYIAFLDIEKAFDTLFMPGLMYKLYISGMRLKPWRLIQDSYTNYECAAYVAGRPGSWFIPERGIHQGTPLSMHMYHIYIYIYINELINQLRDGAMVSNIDATSPGYVDDLAIASIYKTGLNHLVQTAYQYNKTWLLEFSVDESLCMVWGRDHLPGIPVVLGNRELKLVDECKHMGVKLTNTMLVKRRILHESIGKGRNSLLAARYIGSHRTPCTLITVVDNTYIKQCIYTYGIPYSKFTVVINMWKM